jgi:tetratricopeptide (TPR) repeat protein
MRLQSTFLYLTAALILFSGSLAARAQSPDRIFMQGEQSPKLGRVVEEPLDQLVWKPKSDQGNEYFDAKETSWNQIRGIRFGEQPENFQTARNLIQSGKELDRAIELLQEIVEKKEVNRSFFIPRAQYLIADIRYQQASDASGYRTALDAYQTAIDQYPDNRGFFEAIQRTFELHRRLDQYEQALSAADRLIERNPRDRGGVVGALLKTRVLMERENYQEALRSSQQALNEAQTSRHKIKAKRLVAENQLKLERYGEARSTYQDFIDQKQTLPEGMRDRLLTAAHNGIGRAYYHQNYKPNAQEESVRSQNVQVLKDALLHFMKGVVWFRFQGQESTERERSLYWVARCFADLKENVSERERIEKYTMEARRAINTLLNKYPKSQFRREVQRLSNRL